MFFFFFKQKTAYEMRISDWSSDVCSSDVQCGLLPFGDPERHDAAVPLHLLAGDGVAGVLLEAGVDHLGDLRMSGAELDDLLCVLTVPVHPHAVCFETAVTPVRCEGTAQGTD